MRHAELYCTRCQETRVFEVPDPKWRLAFRAWLVISGLSTLLWPIATFDLFCMTPVLAIIPLALGPLHRMASQDPACTVCGRTSVSPMQPVKPDAAH